MVRAVRGVVRRARHLGRGPARRSGEYLAAAQARREPRPVHRRHGAGAADGAGHRADRQLLQQGAVRPADHAALGAGDPVSVPGVRRHPSGRPALRHVPAHLPLRADLRLRLGRRADLARAPLQDQAARPVRPVRVRLLGLPDLRGVAADRFLGPHLRAAAEHVHRLDPDRGRRGLVLPHPAPPGARAGRRAGPAPAPAGGPAEPSTGRCGRQASGSRRRGPGTGTPPATPRGRAGPCRREPVPPIPGAPGPCR